MAAKGLLIYINLVSFWSDENLRRVLNVSLGASPQILTETLWALDPATRRQFVFKLYPRPLGRELAALGGNVATLHGLTFHQPHCCTRWCSSVTITIISSRQFNQDAGGSVGNRPTVCR